MRRSIQRRKDGSAFFDGVTLVAALFLLAIGIYVIALIISGFNTAMQGDEDITADVKAQQEDTKDLFIETLDDVFFLFLIVFWGLSILLSWEIGSSSIWMWISLALSVFLFLFAAIMAEGYADFSSTAGIATFSLLFPKIHFIMNHLIQTIVAYFVTILIALFIKGGIE